MLVASFAFFACVACAWLWLWLCVYCRLLLGELRAFG